jgi:hypothetical protein
LGLGLADHRPLRVGAGIVILSGLSLGFGWEVLRTLEVKRGE